MTGNKRTIKDFGGGKK